MWELATSVGAICCTLAGHEKKEVGEQYLLLHGGRGHSWNRRGLKVLFGPLGFGLFQDMVMYIIFIIQTYTHTKKKKEQ